MKLQFEGVGFGYPEQAPILSDINLTLNSGERLLLIGRNGSGKSTLAYLAAGILAPTAGRIRWSGSPDTADAPLPARKVGIVFQQSRAQIVGTTPEEDLAFGLSLLQLPASRIRAKVDHYLELFQLTERRNQSVNHLSGGELRRLALAAVLITEPALLILDEPMAMLDYANRQILLDCLRQSVPAETAVLWLDHDLRNCRHCRRWMLLNREGRVQDVSLGELSSESFLKGEQLEPAPLQFLEWLHPESVSKAIFGPERMIIT